MFTISRCRWYVLTDVCAAGREGLVHLRLPLQYRREHLLHALLLLPSGEYTFDIGGVLFLGYAILSVRITEAFGLPKLSLFCNVQRDVASLLYYSKLNSNSSHVIIS